MFAYLVTGPGGKQYVGITSKTVGHRWKQHLRDAERRICKSALHDAILKYGANAFKVEQIATMSTWEEACQYEQAAINRYGTFGRGGYNLTLGGEGRLGSKHAEAFKVAQSDRFKGVKRGEAFSQKLRAAHASKTSEQKARVSQKIAKANASRSEEERARISMLIADSKRGKKRDAETIEKMSVSMRGKRHSAEVRARMSVSHRGFVHSAESLAKMSESAQARREQTAAAMREVWRVRKAASAQAKAEL